MQVVLRVLMAVVLLLMLVFSLAWHNFIRKRILSIQLLDLEDIEDPKGDSQKVEKVLEESQHHRELQIALLQVIKLRPAIQISTSQDSQNEPEQAEHSLCQKVYFLLSCVARGLANSFIALGEGEESRKVEESDVEERVEYVHVLYLFTVTRHFNYTIQQVEKSSH
eukprot:CAMPEP_0170552936 /NCGR_PEP_ID=MMETSP0211-20121228/10822_1 /TAXON_ID=311385 /ORGANISM="Pseudokeronopsis sp., Strain OXSARD2" /LENGTH=165 /DNA_ID=CAMNT_0010861003 /DNA_START=62 /DNA_END=559 /DNA_ORIENTATION=+